MSAPKIQWGAEADRDLLLTLIEDIQISGLKWAQITTKMETKGYSPLGPQSCQ
jgi:3-methyladenine DNA glycosylase Tag